MSLAVSTYQIMKHLLNYTEPHLQLYIIRILLMIPVIFTSTYFYHFPLTFLLTLEFRYIRLLHGFLLWSRTRSLHSTQSEICKLSDYLLLSYEGYVLYTFMQLLIHFLGGENSLIVHLEFKVYSHFNQPHLEENQAAVAIGWAQTPSNRQVSRTFETFLNNFL